MLTISMEAYPTNPEEVAFAHHFFEVAADLQLLIGEVSATLFRTEPADRKLRGQIYWTGKKVGIMTFDPADPRKTSHTKEWFSKFFEPAVMSMVESDLRACIQILWRLDKENAKRIEDLLHIIHPEWYYLDF